MHEQSKKTFSWMALGGFILLSESAGLIGGLFTANSVSTWYTLLARPLLTPPAWVFGPVWTTLYALMGVAMYLVWQQTRGGERRTALGIFLVQLVLNALWSVIFFGLQNPGGAFLEILALWCAIVVTMVIFARHSRTAVWLLAPYLLWTSFAAYLNYAFWMLNG